MDTDEMVHGSHFPAILKAAAWLAENNYPVKDVELTYNEESEIYTLRTDTGTKNVLTTFSY